jgi:probable HAF family extracellular repeat protein
MKKQAGVAFLLAWLTVFFLAGPAPAVKFRYEDLGTLGNSQPYLFFDGKQAGINDAGQVAGISYTADGALHAFAKSPGQPMLDLGGLIPGSGYSYAPGLNNSGVIGGWYNDGGNLPHACKWTPQPGGNYNVANLAGTGSMVRGINDAGYLAGAAGSAGQVWSPAGAPQVLGILPGNDGCVATAINNGNTVVGYAWVNSTGTFTACSWSPSGSSFAEPASLFGVADSRAFAINNKGQAVGYVRESFVFHAVLKSPGQEGFQDLGRLFPNFSALAYDINDSGLVVGEADEPLTGTNAFLWTSATGMQNLNNLVVNLPAGVRLVRAMGINRQGQIAGYTANRVFKLTPVFAEAPLSLLLLD